MRWTPIKITNNELAELVAHYHVYFGSDELKFNKNGIEFVGLIKKKTMSRHFVICPRVAYLFKFCLSNNGGDRYMRRFC